MSFHTNRYVLPMVITLIPGGMYSLLGIQKIRFGA